MDTPLAPASLPAPVSVIDAAHEALDHTRRHLFPIQFLRWLTLGLVAFLDQCGRGTGFGGGGVPGAPASHGGSRFDPAPLLRWALHHPLPAALIGGAALMVILALLAAVLWVNSRGTFAYVDLVATGRAEVARPWREHRGPARSYFSCRLGLVLVTAAGLLAMALALGAAALGAVGRRAAPSAGLVLIGFGLLLLMLVFAVAMSVLSVLLRDFVAPLQLSAGVSCVEAARALALLLRMHGGVFAVYMLLKIAFTLALAAAMIAVCCGTCALGLLPVIGQTVLQPAYFFERAWSLFLLRQMGHDVFAALAPSVVVSPGE